MKRIHTFKTSQNLFYLTSSLILAFISFIPSISKAAPQAYFTAYPRSGCEPLLVNYFNASAPGSYHWNFGDPSSGGNDTSLLCSPYHIYDAAGTYITTLTVKIGLNTYTTSDTIIVYPRPKPVIKGDTGLCINSTSIYSVPLQPGCTYTWAVNGGSYTANASHDSITVNWGITGTGTVTVSETNSYGCTGTYILSVFVSPLPNPVLNCNESSGTSASGGTKGQNTPTCVCAYSFQTITMPDDGSTYYWTVTGGTIVSGQNSDTLVVHWGAAPGLAIVQVVETNVYGCKDSSKCINDICADPVASFTANNACAGGTVNFNSSASVGNNTITGYSWNLGNNSTYTNPDPSTTYATPGTYNATLTVTNQNGCTADTTEPIQISPGSCPKIYCPSTVCADAMSTYYSDYVAGATYNWTVTGDASYTTSSNGDTIHVVWGNGPLGTITLFVINGGYTCTSPTIVDIPIFPINPSISGPTIVCPYSTETYCAPSIPGSIYSWTVSGGSVTSQSGNCVDITWGSGIGGMLILHMSNSLICCTGKDTIFVNIKPQLYVTGNQSVCLGSTATYSTSPLVNGNWTAIGGTINGVSTNVSSVSVTWNGPSPGEISIKPTVSGVYCNATANLSITINPLPPPANIAGPSIVCQGVTTTYTNTPGTNDSWSVISPNSIVSGQNKDTVTVKWVTAGIDTLKVTQTNAYGCTITTDYAVQVVPSALPTINGKTTVCANAIDTYTIPSNPGGVYSWEVVGGNILSGLGTNSISVQWGFISQGTVTINNTACGTSSHINVNVYPVPVVTIDTSGMNCAGTSLTLTATPGFAHYLWSTGATSQIITITHGGTYWVKATNAGGCYDSVSIVLPSVLPSLPHPSCSITITPMVSPFPLWAFSVAYAPGNTYSWSNGATTDTIFVTDTGHVYSVTVTNQFGCTSSCSAKVHGGVGPCIGCNNYACVTNYTCLPFGTHKTLTAPSGAIWSWNTGATSQSIIVDTGGTFRVIYKTCVACQPDTCYFIVSYQIQRDSFVVSMPLCNPIDFTNYCIGATNYLWSFGDGAYSNAVNPAHSYSDTGYYKVTLRATSGNGCWDSVMINIHIRSVLIPNYTYIPKCSDTVLFTNTSFVRTYGTVNYHWNFGDIASGPNNTSILANPTHIFSGPGNYKVTLILSDGICTDSISKIIAAPYIAAFIGNCGACSGQTTQLIDNSVSTSPLVTWLWKFGDGDSTTIENPWHVYSIPGTYTVKLTIMNSNGCTATTSATISVAAFLAGNITKSGSDTFCEGDSVVLTAPVSASYLWSNGALTQSITVKQSGNFNVIVVNGSGCKDTIGPVSVTVNPTPKAVILPGGPITTCQQPNPNGVILNAPSGTGYTFKWYFNGAVIPYATASNYTVMNPSQSGIYTVVVSNMFGCKDSSAPVSVTIKAAPSGYIYGSPFCAGDSTNIAFYGSGAVTYHWSTGATSASIYVHTGGNYTCLITGSNGCTTLFTTTVVENPLPDFSQLPQGCYTICKGSIDTVCAPAPPQYYTYNYQWYLNGSPIAGGTHECIGISAAGNYSVKVTNTSTGCSATSIPFEVSVVPGPIASITSSGGTFLCAGSSQTLTLTANSGPDYSYLWSTEATTQSITINKGGTYWVKVMLNKCCFAVDTIHITTIANCCFPPGTVFTIIPNGYTINSSQVWEGHYFIQGKVYVNNSAILDLTEVDLVFDSTGEIIFNNKSIIRANNSVFRPCQMNGTWIGMTFKDSSWGYIDVSIYKNATIAVNILTNDTFSIRLIDNSFVNCNTGIYVDKAKTGRYTMDISGNSFNLDNISLPFASPNSYFGIKALNTDFNNSISQNSFINSSRIYEGKRYYGIQMISSSADVTKNTFSNMYRSFDVTNPDKYYSIENNQIEITQSTSPNDYQVRVSSSIVPFLIFNNNITNSMQDFNATAAIYGINSSLMNIIQNNITGYGYGVQIFHVQNSQVVENTIADTKLIGIYYRDSMKGNSNVYISCNNIRMDLLANSISKPVGIYVDDADQYTYVYTNCVFDCYASIYLNAIVRNTPMPIIKNNYLYNYTNYGIYNFNYLGSIGTSSSIFAKAGRNTFDCNNFSVGLDIFSNLAIVESGNYGVLATNILVSQVGTADLFNSTADCGEQIRFNQLTQLDAVAICDQYNLELYPVVVSGTGGTSPTYSLASNFVQSVNNMDSNARLQFAASILSTLSNNIDNADMELFYNAISSSNLLSHHDNQWFAYDNEVLMKQYPLALQSLGTIQPANNEEADKIKLERLKMNMAITGTHLQALSEGNQAILNIIEADGGPAGLDARDMLQLIDGKNEFIFDQPSMPEMVRSDSTLLYCFSGDYIQVYPNPVHNKLNIIYYTNDQNAEKESIQIQDAYGRTVNSIPVVYNGTSFSIDVSTLANGLYILSISSATEHSRLKVKFIKI